MLAVALIPGIVAVCLMMGLAAKLMALLFPDTSPNEQDKATQKK